jgi:hypothetical protein
MMPSKDACLRKRASRLYRQKLILGLLPVPGTEPRNPPLNHHGVDLVTIRKMIDVNRSSIKEGWVVYPGLGVSKHPMTVETEKATYLAGWAFRDGTRPISVLGEPSLTDGKILFLQMGEPMAYTGRDEIVCVTEPVIFIGRRLYQGISAEESQTAPYPSSEDFEWMTKRREIPLFSPTPALQAVEK